METYLHQMESSPEPLDQESLAQLSSGLDANLAAIGDYLFQLDDTELAQLTTLI